MSAILWVPFLSYMVVTAISPGPNNILALGTTIQYGWKRSQKLLTGIYCGFLSVMLLCGLFGKIMHAVLPSSIRYLSCLGAAYILWLAWHVGKSAPPAMEENVADRGSFWKGFLLQFVNVKIILSGITAFVAFLPQDHTSWTILGFALVIALIGNGATLIWAVTGSVLQRFLKKHWRPINLIMAALLVYSAVRLLVS